MNRELVIRLNSVDALYHAAHRYERDPIFRENVHNPEWVASSLRESAARIESMHAERAAQLRKR